MPKKKILICGASGFIGRNIFETFRLNQNFEVHGTYLNQQPVNIKPWVQNLYRVDLTNTDNARTLTAGMDVVIHAAAKTDGAETVNKNPAGYFPDNIRINTNVIQAACENKVGHLVFMSCPVMYPHTSKPLNEDGANIYNVYPPYFFGARVKVLAEDLCKFFSGITDTKFTIVRHCATYGPYDKFGANGHACPAIIAKVIKSTDGTLTLNGNGLEKRDLLYISDLVRFIEMAIERQVGQYEIFNVGLGKSVSITTLAEKIIEASGKQITVQYDLTKQNMATDMMLDIAKAEKLIGWKPGISLEEGLRRTLDWYIGMKIKTTTN